VTPDERAGRLSTGFDQEAPGRATLLVNVIKAIADGKVKVTSELLVMAPRKACSRW
jgi:hypothetical protein